MTRGVGYESRQAPVVERNGAVPDEIVRALTRVIDNVPSQGAYGKNSHLLRAFLVETCAALAQARAQVLADRAELDGWRNRYRSEQQSA